MEGCRLHPGSDPIRGVDSPFTIRLAKPAAPISSNGHRLKELELWRLSDSVAIRCFSEFKTETAIYSAAVDRTAGSIIALMKKSGSSEPYRSACELLRSNARGWLLPESQACVNRKLPYSIYLRQKLSSTTGFRLESVGKSSVKSRAKWWRAKESICPVPGRQFPAAAETSGF
jgi:hypothetical protein